MDDMISRKAAVDEFNRCDLTPDGGIDINEAIYILEHLPSAQPEGTIDRKQAIDAALEIIGDSAHRKAWEIVAMLKRIGKEEENDDDERVSEADR